MVLSRSVAVVFLLKNLLYSVIVINLSRIAFLMAVLGRSRKVSEYNQSGHLS